MQREQLKNISLALEPFGLRNREYYNLAMNSRCTYHIPNKYIFVYHNSKSANQTIMHELFHFYTWHVFQNKLNNIVIPKEKYNDIKESLTELLNLEFSDLMDRRKGEHKLK